MPLRGGRKVIFDVPETLLEKIDDYRFTHRKASRAEALRELITKGLQFEEIPQNPRQAKKR